MGALPTVDCIKVEGKLYEIRHKMMDSSRDDCIYIIPEGAKAIRAVYDNLEEKIPFFRGVYGVDPGQTFQYFRVTAPYAEFVLFVRALVDQEVYLIDTWQKLLGIMPIAAVYGCDLLFIPNLVFEASAWDAKELRLEAFLATSQTNSLRAACRFITHSGPGGEGSPSSSLSPNGPSLRPNATKEGWPTEIVKRINTTWYEALVHGVAMADQAYVLNGAGDRKKPEYWAKVLEGFKGKVLECKSRMLAVCLRRSY